MKLKKIPTLVRTLWYIPPKQIWARIWARLKRYYYQTPIYPLLLEKTGTPDKPTIQPTKLWKGCIKHAEEIKNQRSFTFVGHQIIKPEGQWLLPKASPLWTFNLHYWDWLADLHTAKDQQTAQTLIEDWLLHCDSYHPVIWHPYPTSLRIVNMLVYGEWVLKKAPESLKDAFWSSLQRQLIYLSNNLEWDLGGNHLIKNIKTLIFGGVCLPAGQSLVLEGQKLLLQQLKHQILPDGGHYERSPMYHVQVLMDLLEIQALLRKAGLKIPPLLDDALDRMSEALAFYRYPDGKLGLFNDSEEKSCAELDALTRRCGKSKPPNEVTNYVRLRQKDLFVMFDAGKIGPDELPGHSHAQTLSFELCLGEERIFVNSGTYAYQHKLRSFLRSTAAHNTIVVDEENSAEIWAEHRVGRRPTHVEKKVQLDNNGNQQISASHNGYRHLGITHYREMTLTPNGSSVKGTDKITTTKNNNHRVKAHFHLHPSVECQLIDEQHARLTTKNNQNLTFKVEGGRLYTLPSQYAPQFGIIEETTQLVIQGFWRNGCHISWSLSIEKN